MLPPSDSAPLMGSHPAATTWSGNERSELMSRQPRSPLSWPAEGEGPLHGCTRLLGQALEVSPARGSLTAS